MKCVVCCVLCVVKCVVCCVLCVVSEGACKKWITYYWNEMRANDWLLVWGLSGRRDKA